jgi:Domain of unknown function (DUF4232)
MRRVLNRRLAIVVLPTFSALLLAQPLSEPPARGVSVTQSPRSGSMPVKAESASALDANLKSRCTGADLLVRAGREAGGSFGLASATVQFADTAHAPCRLSGAPRVAVLRADGTRLPVRFTVGQRATLQSVLLPSGPHWSASMTLSWSNWCGADPGTLIVTVRLRQGGAVTGSFGGPPGYDFVPGCLDKQSPSRLVLLDAYETPSR